jgi:hypothetical protein
MAKAKSRLDSQLVVPPFELSNAHDAYLASAGLRRTGLGSCVLSPLDWTVKGLVMNHGVHVVYGASGSGKTFFVAHMAMCVASGIDFLKCKVKRKGRVAYIAGEKPKSVERRLAVMRDHDKTFADVKFHDDDISVFSGAIDLLDDARASVLIEGIASFNAFEDPFRLIVIDTLSASFAGVDENSPQMALVVRRCADLSRRLDCPVVLLHHSGHSAGERERGHSSLRANVDQSIFIGNKANPREAEVMKVTDSATGDKLSFDVMNVHTGMLDEDGDIVSGAVVQLSAFDPKAKDPLKAKKTLTNYGRLLMQAYELAWETRGGSSYVSEQLLQSCAESLFSDDLPHRASNIARGKLDVKAKNWLKFEDNAWIKV